MQIGDKVFYNYGIPEKRIPAVVTAVNTDGTLNLLATDVQGNQFPCTNIVHGPNPMQWYETEII